MKIEKSNTHTPLSLKEKFHKYALGIPKFDFTMSCAMLYHENSKLTDITARRLGLKVEAFNDPYLLKRASQPFKTYPGKKIISLKQYKDAKLPKRNIFEIIQKRKSVRNYTEHTISLFDIFVLCNYAYGVTRKSAVMGTNKGSWLYRTVPSAGALYPLELYIVLFSGEISPGFYHYRPDINALEFLKEGTFYEKLKENIFAEPVVELKNACCLLIITGIFERVLMKYGDRGYRFILMEAGFVSQNISLICEAIGLGSCMIGGYKDDELHNFFRISGMSEALLNVLVIGKGST